MTRLRLLCVALALAVVPRLAEAQLAVVVNPANASSELTLNQLRRLYTGEAATYPNGGRARLAALTPAAASFYNALGQTKERIHARWMALVFAGEAAGAPTPVATPDAVRAWLQQHPDGLTFVPLAAVDASMKVLKIDGHAPSDPAYPIR